MKIVMENPFATALKLRFQRGYKLWVGVNVTVKSMSVGLNIWSIIVCKEDFPFDNLNNTIQVVGFLSKRLTSVHHFDIEGTFLEI